MVGFGDLDFFWIDFLVVDFNLVFNDWFIVIIIGGGVFIGYCGVLVKLVVLFD